MNEHRVLGVVLLVAAALLVANPLYIFQHPDEVNKVVVGNSYDRTPAANYTYDELSPRGKTVVRKAIESDTHGTRFHGDDRRPSEFEFAAPPNKTRDSASTVYRISDNGTDYTVTYTHHYETNTSRLTVGNTANQRPAAAYAYANLSTRGQDVFDRALTAENNTTRISSTARPPEFSVPPRTAGSSGFAGEVYRVEYNGTNYTIETYAPPQLTNPETHRSQALMAYGLILALIGALFVWREQPFVLGVLLGGLGVVFLVLNLGYRYTPDLVGWLSVFGSSIFVVLALLAGIVSAGYLLYKTNRERQLTRRV
ncbi:MAG: hypothetical protein ABEI77_07170 [Halorientalis sp.]